MTLDNHTIKTLRTLFATGVMPSRLIQYLAGCYSNDRDWPSHIRLYFSAAFSVVLLEREYQAGAVALDDGTKHYLNTDTLHEMVGRAHLWRGTLDPTLASTRLWFDGLTVAPDELSLIDHIHPDQHPALSDSWATMSQQAKDFVRQAMINSQSYYEKTQILARLVEQLQGEIARQEHRFRAVDQTNK